MTLDSIDNGPLVYSTVEENGQTRPKKYFELTKAQQLQDDCDVQETNIILHGLPPDVHALSKFVTNVKLDKSLYTPPNMISSNSPTLYNPSQSPQHLDSGLAGPLFHQGEYPIECINKAMTDDLDAYDSDCDNLSSAKAILMENLSIYDQDFSLSVISKEHVVISVIDDEETLILEEESRSKMLDKKNDQISIEKKIKISPFVYSKLNKIKEDFGKRFVTKKNGPSMGPLTGPSTGPSIGPSTRPSTGPFMRPSIGPSTGPSRRRSGVFEEKSKGRNKRFHPLGEYVITLYTSGKLCTRVTVTLLSGARGMFKLDIKPISARLMNNRDAYEVYIDKTTEYANTLHGLVERARTHSPSEPLLESACMFTKHVMELLVYAYKHALFHQNLTDSLKTKDSNKPLLTSTGVIPTTSASKSKPSRNTKNTRISRPPRSNQKNKVEDHPTTIKSSLNKMNSISEHISNALVKHSMSNAKSESICAICNKFLFDANHDMCLVDFVNDVNKDHLCSACALGKSKKSSHQPKAKDTNQEKLYLLHMDLCGPLRMESINGKRINDAIKVTLFDVIPCNLPKRDDWDTLLQPLFDEYFNPLTIDVFTVPIAAAPRAVEIANLAVSMSIDQDAPSSKEKASNQNFGAVAGEDCYRLNPSSNPTPSINLKLKGRNCRRSKQRIEEFNLEELSPPIITMADQRTMAQLLQAPTEGYEDAIVVRDCSCSKGSVEDKILVPKPPKNCASTNVVNAPREPFIVKQDHGVNLPYIDECCCECGEAVDGIMCQQCACKSCGKGAHIGYNCPPKVPIQTMNNEPPQTLPSFDSTCYSDKEISVPCVSKPNFVDESSNIFNPPPQPPISSCEFCRRTAQYGHYCTPQAPFVNPEPGYSQDLNFPQDIHNFQQQFYCWLGIEFPKFRMLLKTSNINQRMYKSCFVNFLMICKIFTRSWLSLLIVRVGIVLPSTTTMMMTWTTPLQSYPFYPPSVWDEHLDTIPVTESDEVIKSSVEDLVPIPSEFKGIPDTMCDVHLVNNPTPLDDKDHFEIVINSNDDYSSSDDNSLYYENIEYVEASPHDSEFVSLEVEKIVISEDEEIEDDNLCEKLLKVNLLIAKIEALKDNPSPSSEFLTKSSSTSPKPFLEGTNTFHNYLPEFENFCFDLEEISSGSTTTHSDISLLEYDAFSLYDDHIKEISSGSTTPQSDISLPEYDLFIFDPSNDQFPPIDRSDLTHEEFGDEPAHIISPPEYDCFYFGNLLDPGELTSSFNSRIRENLSSTTCVNLPGEDDYFPLLTYVVWIFLAYLMYPIIPPHPHSFGNKDTIFDPGITINHFYSFKLGLSHWCGNFKEFNTHRSHLNESSMEMLFSTLFPMDQ
nr:integrase, catalytic region, zinc finger, CCHC-type, peptidase aspartic, catalytic [Tanacetum cinerariifolium]